MSYQSERDQFIARMSKEGLDLAIVTRLLGAATTLQRLAELSCSSEAADRDRVPCPRVKGEQIAARSTIAKAIKAFFDYPCLCDLYQGSHSTVPRIDVQGARLSRRLIASLPAGWAIDEQGDPRGYVLRVIPPSYADRNAGRDRHNLETISVPARESRLRFSSCDSSMCRNRHTFTRVA